MTKKRPKKQVWRWLKWAVWWDPFNFAHNLSFYLVLEPQAFPKPRSCSMRYRQVWTDGFLLNFKVSCIICRNNSRPSNRTWIRNLPPPTSVVTHGSTGITKRNIISMAGDQSWTLFTLPNLLMCGSSFVIALNWTLGWLKTFFKNPAWASFTLYCKRF